MAAVLGALLGLGVLSALFLLCAAFLRGAEKL